MDCNPLDPVRPRLYWCLAFLGFLALLAGCSNGGAARGGPAGMSSATPPPASSATHSAQRTPAASASATPSPGAAPTATPAPQASPTPASAAGSTPTPAAGGQQTPTRTPLPAGVPAPAETPDLTPAAGPEPVMLKVLSPVDGSGVEMGSVRVAGVTSAQRVEVNGATAQVKPDGSFQHDVSLRNGVNLVRVVASDLSGMSVSQQLVVFYGATTAGLPFTLLYPPDGLEVNVPYVDVIGVTRPDAVVGVNEIPVEVNSLGVFSLRLPLAEGGNLVEVVAVDIHGNVRFQTSGVFYVP